MSEYGFMPFEACDLCGQRWPTRYQYSIRVEGPEGFRIVLFCQTCFAQMFEVGVRGFNRRYTGTTGMWEYGTGRPLKESTATERSPEGGGG